MKIKQCDFCGRNENDVRISSYKIKKEWWLMWEHGWERKDICVECLKKLREGGDTE